jgi:hypothetical protein
MKKLMVFRGPHAALALRQCADKIIPPETAPEQRERLHRLLGVLAQNLLAQGGFVGCYMGSPLHAESNGLCSRPVNPGPAISPPPGPGPAAVPQAAQNPPQAAQGPVAAANPGIVVLPNG